jgi:hypothetical protein
VRDDAGMIVGALKSLAEQEFTVAERLTSKARQAFALGAGFYVVTQSIAFGSFDASRLTAREHQWVLGLSIAAAVLLGVAGLASLRADAPVSSGDLPLARLEDDLNAAYEGDPDVVGRLGSYYLGVVTSRRKANAARLTWYRRARFAVVLSLLGTIVELIFALAART